MMPAATTTHATGARAGNEHFANDASYESVSRMIYKIAIRCFSRVKAMGLGMTFDDVHQEMNLSYVLARETWDPERGIRFTTYLTTSCYRNFNSRIFKPERERRLLGMVNMVDMRATGGNRMDDDDQDMMEVYGECHTEVQEPMNLLQGMLDGAKGNSEQEEHLFGDPLEILERKQEALRNLRSISELTPVSRDYVVALIKAARTGDDLPTIRELGTQRNVPKQGLARMRLEINKKFGVK